MLTIDRLAKIDNIAGSILVALHRGVKWLGDHYEARLVNAAYRIAEAKTAAIGKTEDKISDLEDAHAELVAYGAEARTILREKYKAALDALDKELTAKGNQLNDELAAAAEKLVAANKSYDQTVSAAYEKLGVEV